MKITLTVDGVTRNFNFHEDALHHFKFTEVVRDMLDSIEEAKKI